MYLIIIVRIISPWVISLTSALNRGWAYNTVGEYTIYKRLYLYKNFELKRRWAYNTSWAYNTYYTVVDNTVSRWFYITVQTFVQIMSA